MQETQGLLLLHEALSQIDVAQGPKFNTCRTRILVKYVLICFARVDFRLEFLTIVGES